MLVAPTSEDSLNLSEKRNRTTRAVGGTGLAQNQLIAGKPGHGELCSTYIQSKNAHLLIM
jgi:hypothetical protein